MTQDQLAIVLAGVLGYAQQFLRGFKWYNDTETFAFALVLGIVGAFMVAPTTATWQMIAFSALSLTLTIMGGTAVATGLSHVSPLAPKFNQYSGPPK